LERKRLALIGAMKRRAKRSHNGFIRGDATRRDAPVNVETRPLSRDRVEHGGTIAASPHLSAIGDSSTLGLLAVDVVMSVRFSCGIGSRT
jgi:hypothetical protein